MKARMILLGIVFSFFALTYHLQGQGTAFTYQGRLNDGANPADRSTRHVGPMAQDFHAAFGFNGPDDKHIATVDESGVALAAIQGLNLELADKAATLAEQDARIQTQAAEIQQLRQSLAELQAFVSQLAKNQSK